MQVVTTEHDFTSERNLRIGILSDTHGELNSQIAELITQCDIALHAGDIMGFTPLSQLKPKLGHVFSVKGNNDFTATWAAEHHQILEQIPDQTTLHLTGGELVIEHSHRVYDENWKNIHAALRRDHAHAKLVVYGHTHIRTVDQTALPWLLNPGAAGRVRTHDGPSCIVLTVKNEDWIIEEHVFAHAAQTTLVA